MSKKGPPPKYNREDVLQAIIDYKMAHNGDSPQLRELMALTGVKSTSNMAKILHELHESGRIVLVKVSPHHFHINVEGGQWGIWTG